jgi:CheY-specific phosphatase CheX
MKMLSPQNVRLALVKATRKTWSTLLHKAADPVPSVVRQVGNYSLESIVHFEGAWSGSLSLVAAPGNATHWASAMFGVDADHCCDDDILDAAGELANIIAGGVKTLLPEGTVLTPPRVKVRPPQPRGPRSPIISAVEFGDAPMNFVVALLGPATRKHPDFNKKKTVRTPS